MTWNKKIRKILILCAGLVLAGCSAKGASESSYVSVDNNAKDAYASADSAAEIEAEGAGAWEYNEEKTAEEAVITGEKLVYRGYLSIQTKDYEESAQALRAKVREFGGFIEDENEYSQGGYYTAEEDRSWVLNITARIPTEHFEEFMNGSSEIGNVVSRSSGTENISTRYNDVSAEIEALEIQQTRLLEMMDKAETIEDMIAVESRLSDVQYNLNRLKTNRAAMDTDVAYSTVTVNLNEVRIYTETSENFFTRLGSRFMNGFRNFGDVLASLVLGIAYLFPYLLIGGLVIFFLVRKKVFAKIHLPKHSRKDGE